MYDNTLIIFTSDNGGPIYEPGAASNHPLRGSKYNDWEGGVRTNAWVSGEVVEKKLHQMIILPTIKTGGFVSLNMC